MKGFAALRGAIASLAIGAALAAGLASTEVPAAKGDAAAAGQRPLVALSTGRDSELRETVPISRQRQGEPRVVMSLALPELEPGDKIEANAEVVATTTCVVQSARCIGARYGFDPRVGAELVLAQGARTTGGQSSMAVSERAEHKCRQERPYRNHHCPLVVDEARLTVEDLSSLPCEKDRCRLNYVMDASHPDAGGGEVVVVGADRPDGTVAQGKGRVNAVLERAGGQLDSTRLTSGRRRARSLPASFHGGYQVTYSKKIASPSAGEVLVASARQVTATGGRYPYFVANAIIVTSRPRAPQPSQLAKRSVSLNGTITETNGFNCTPGPSAFQSPCVSRKAGIVRIERTPGRPLYVSLISRTFPKLSQARATGYADATVLRGGGIEVRRIRAR